jgi:hypothetical protein
VWQSFYPFAHVGLSYRSWSSILPLWGSPLPPEQDDQLVPYFWGLRVDGQPLAGLSDAARAIAGRDDRLEVDLLLAGERTLIAVEAKTDAEPGRCVRYEASRCPEVHGGLEPCRYWESGASFSELMDFGPRPASNDAARPPCARHYQLARTLLMVQRLGRTSGLQPQLCLILPRRRWPALRPLWLDFAERVRDEELWRCLRVVAWEDLSRLSPTGTAQAPAPRRSRA